MTPKFIQGRSQIADKLISEMKAQKTPYIKEIFDLNIKVNHGVYPPEEKEIMALYLEDSGSNLLNNQPNVLEFGCGSGFLATYAALRGGTVTAIDINENAVRCTIENVKHHNVENKVNTLQSNGFSNIPPNAQFDFIIASLPWEAAEVDSHNDLDIAFYDPNFQMRLALFKEGYDFLKPKGCILLSYSKRVDRLNPMHFFTDKFNFEVVHTQPSMDGNEEEYLYKATKR